MTELFCFPDGDHYLLRHYFENDAAYDALEEYYDSEQYRFRIPADDIEDVQETLYEHGFDAYVVDDPEEFCVVVEQYEPHAEILKRSVDHWTRRDHEFFLMKDRAAVERALQEGATRVEETDLAAGV